MRSRIGSCSTSSSVWAEQFSADDFAGRAGTKSWVVDWDAAAQHVDLLADRLAGILAELKAL